MKRKHKLARFAACLLAASVILAFAVSPALAEDTTEPTPDDGTSDDPASEPVAFSACGVVVAYEIPGVIAQLPEGEGEDEEAVDEEPDEDGTDEDAAEEEVAALEDPADSADGTAPTPAEGTAPTEPAEGTDPTEPAEPAPGAPFITLTNEAGEFTYEVSATVTIEAPQATTGEFIINVGDLAQVSGVDNVVDHITVTPANPGKRSSYAAVPGVVEAIAATGIVVHAADGYLYSFVITEATMVYAGPIVAGVADIAVGAHVVVKGDGAGNAKWIRFTGQSSKAIRHQYRERGAAVGGLNEGGHGQGQGKGKGQGNGKGDGNGRGNGRGRQE